MARRQGAAAGRAAVLPHGRFLRVVLRRRGPGRRGTRHRADRPRRARGQADRHVRRADPRGRGLSGAADPPRLPRRGGRADGGRRRPGRQGPAAARDRPPGDARHADRGLAAGRRPVQPAAGLGPGRPELGAAWVDISTGLFETEAVATSRPCSAASTRRRSWRPPTCSWATIEARAGAGHAAAATPGRAGQGGGGISRRPRSTGSAPSPTPKRWRRPLVLAYVSATQAGQMPALSPPARNEGDGTLAMDAATRASLEITRARDGSAEHTLLASVSRTLTAPGARMLADWLSAPLTDPAAIAARQDWLDRAAGRARRLRHGCARCCAAHRMPRARWGGCRSAAAARATCWPSARSSPSRPRPPHALPGPTQNPGCPVRGARRRFAAWTLPSGRAVGGGTLPAPRRCGWMTAARSPRGSTASWMPSGACATTAAA